MGDIIVGVDLGTTNTCVAVYRNNETKIVVNKEGGRTTPSFVFVTERDAIIVGQHAKKMAEAKPEYGISELKRVIGRRYDDPHVQTNLQYFPFKLTNSDNEPMISVTRNSSNFSRRPVELCGEILRKIKKDTEEKLGCSVTKAVITVPAYFNMSQREATLQAAKNTGLLVVKLLNEPTAAALAYYFENDEGDNYSLVYDLGGGTFDVAILKRTFKNFDIIAVDGDAHLGGHDFDNLIIDYVCDYLDKHYKYSPRKDHRAMRRLQRQCEEAKETLSSAEDALIVLDGYVNGVCSIAIELTREKFENMAKPLFTKTIDIVQNCLDSCKFKKSDIKEIILAGGSTRIPKIQEMISSFFDGKKLNKKINPDECVAEGAAIQAAMFSSNTKQTISSFEITDVTPLSLGIGDFVGLMTPCIKRNTPIPVSETLTRTTVYNKQSSLSFNIYEGERKIAEKNRQLGKVTITDITPCPPGQCKVLVTISIDTNGILTVEATEKLRDNVKKLTINYTRGFRSDKEVKNALIDAEGSKKEDERYEKFATLKGFVLDYCELINYNLEEKNLKNLHKELYELCEEVKKEAKSLGVENEDQLVKLEKKVKAKGDYVATQNNFQFMPEYWQK